MLDPSHARPPGAVATRDTMRIATFHGPVPDHELTYPECVDALLARGHLVRDRYSMLRASATGARRTLVDCLLFAGRFPARHVPMALLERLERRGLVVRAGDDLIELSPSGRALGQRAARARTTAS